MQQWNHSVDLQRVNACQSKVCWKKSKYKRNRQQEIPNGWDNHIDGLWVGMLQMALSHWPQHELKAYHIPRPIFLGHEWQEDKQDEASILCLWEIDLSSEKKVPLVSNVFLFMVNSKILWFFICNRKIIISIWRFRKVTYIHWKTPNDCHSAPNSSINIPKPTRKHQWQKKLTPKSCTKLKQVKPESINNFKFFHHKFCFRIISYIICLGQHKLKIMSYTCFR